MGKKQLIMILSGAFISMLLASIGYQTILTSIKFGQIQNFKNELESLVVLGKVQANNNNLSKEDLEKLEEAGIEMTNNSKIDLEGQFLEKIEDEFYEYKSSSTHAYFTKIEKTTKDYSTINFSLKGNTSIKSIEDSKMVADICNKTLFKEENGNVVCQFSNEILKK